MSAVNAFAPSPVSSSRSIAKMDSRVLVSEPKEKEEVAEKGSAFRVNVSRATARVLAAWLIRTGFLLVAALAGITQASRRKEKVKPLAAQRKKLVLKKDGSGHDFRNLLLSSGKVLRSFEGRPWSVTRLKPISHFDFGPQQ